MNFSASLLLGCLISTQALANIKSVGSEVVPGAGSQSCVLEVKSTKLGIKGYAPFCSGTVVSKRKILTAAHCVTDIKSSYLKQDPAAEFRARCNPTVTTSLDGSSKATFGEEVSLVTASLWSHPKYVVATANAPITSNDVGLYESSVDMKTPAAEIASLSKVVNPLTGAIDTTKFNCKDSGYGRNQSGKSGFPLSFELKNVSFRPTTAAAIAAGDTVQIDQSLVIQTKKMSFEDIRAVSFTLGMFYDQLLNPQTASGVIAPMLNMMDQLGLLKWSVMPGDSGGGIVCNEIATGKDYVVAVNSAIAPGNIGDFYQNFMSKDSSEFQYTNEFSPIAFTLDASGNPVVAP